MNGIAWWGPWVVLLASLGWASGTFATTRLPTPANPFAMAAVQMFIGGLILLGTGTALGEQLDPAAVSPVSWWVSSSRPSSCSAARSCWWPWCW